MRTIPQEIVITGRPYQLFHSHEELERFDKPRFFEDFHVPKMSCITVAMSRRE